MTAAIGFKRLGLALLAVIAVGSGVLVAASYLISADAVRRQVLSEIRTVTGLNPSLRTWCWATPTDRRSPLSG